MTDTRDALLRGVAAAIAEESDLFSWIEPEAGEPYPVDAVGIYLGTVPASVPRALTLTAYTVSMRPDAVEGVQARFTAPGDSDLSRMSQAVSDVLEARWGGMLGTVKLVTSAWQSGTDLGQDTDGRRQATDNYYLKIARTIPHL